MEVKMKNLQPKTLLLVNNILATIIMVIWIQMCIGYIRVTIFLLHIPKEDFSNQLMFLGICFVFIIGFIIIHIVPSLLNGLVSGIKENYAKIK